MSSVNENMICETIKMLRTKRGISQEVLAQALDISVQAVSKWETGNSLPDILQLPRIAEFFGTTIDDLFHGIQQVDITSFEGDMSELKDDGKLRIVQFIGNKCLGSEKWIKDKAITLCTKDMDNKIDMEIWGAAHINGDINGYLEAAGEVECGNVGGYVEAASGVNCGNVGGYVEAADGVKCGNVGGYVEAADGIKCGNVSGDVNAGNDVMCNNVKGSIECGRDIRCSSIDSREINCTNLYCNGDVKANTIEGEIHVQKEIDF
jgi:transcriptional regulator with XRE-family HTH domain